MKKDKRKIVIITGAGVSAESGLKTFRDSDGLWENHKVEEVATPSALKNNTKLFLDFYNARKNQLQEVEPNKAHQIISEMEKDFDVTIVTQNIDNLHERAGSSNVLHLHGELAKMRSSGDTGYMVEYKDDIKVGDRCPQGHQLRPHVVLFGENLPSENFHKSILRVSEADVIIVIGTSLQVRPASQLPWEGKDTSLIYLIDPADSDINIPKQRKPFFYHIKEKATKGIELVYDELREIYL